MNVVVVVVVVGGQRELCNLVIFDLPVNAARWFGPQLCLSAVEVNRNVASHLDQGGVSVRASASRKLTSLTSPPRPSGCRPGRVNRAQVSLDLCHSALVWLKR